MIRTWCQRCKAYYYPLWRTQRCPCNVIDPSTYVPVNTGEAQKARRLKRMIKTKENTK